MILVVISGCMHTPPHPALPEPVHVDLAARHETADLAGRDCSWEEEGLWVGGQRIVGHDAPDAADWCVAPSDHWATVDLLGQDGPFVSVFLEADGDVGRCETWNVNENRPASLVDYDPKHAEARVRRGARLLARRKIPGILHPDSFYVRGGHVVFCVFGPDGKRQDVEVP